VAALDQFDLGIRRNQRIERRIKANDIACWLGGGKRTREPCRERGNEKRLHGFPPGDQCGAARRPALRRA
jgi:hypothetical protein